MKALIREKTQFEIVIDGVTVGVFEKKSDWNGMTDFKAGSSTVVVNDFDSGIFNKMFGAPKEQECEVVTISPSLAPVKAKSEG